ncbi:hypothetical protein LPW36_01495 [Jinshanibacter sp. LJY008]|uniref:Lipoprotein n=1 Tax=Limnobaculum eriocheiris TaxID=2897391 RepID=A0A9X1MTN1_9GAMM|nr:hypothetical protein [Limnobaculum eriocheiris]MCD1124719.1 hypothetical protein [Limnobaculum eriocheiris]
MIRLSLISCLALFLLGCTTESYTEPCPRGSGCIVNDRARPIYNYDPDSDSMKRDRRMERVRDQGTADKSTDQGSIFGW